MKEGSLEMKISIKQIKNSVESIINRLDQEKKEYLRLRNYCIPRAVRRKSSYQHSVQELWDTINRPKLRLLGIEEGAEI
jgi:hypothetical protein